MADFTGKVKDGKDGGGERGVNEQSMGTDEKWMRLALEEAALAQSAGEVPVGAVIVGGEELLARAHNSPIALSDPSAHAELLAIRRAAATRGNYRLTETTLYATLEPCLMCAGAIIQARIGRLVFGAWDPKNGAAVSLYRLFEDQRLNHAVAVTEGVLREACAEILSSFFSRKEATIPPSKASNRRDTEEVVTGSTRNRFGGQKLSRGFESPSLRQIIVRARPR